MNPDFSKTKFQEVKVRAETWLGTAFRLIFGYLIFTMFYCILQFTSLGQLWDVDRSKVPKMNLVYSWMIIYILYSCYVIFRQTAFVLCNNPLVKRVGNAIRNYLDDYALLLYTSIIPFLCFFSRELYDCYARHPSSYFGTISHTVTSLSVDIIFHYGVHLSLYLIPLLAFLYMIALIYKAIRFDREASSPLENSNLPSPSRESLREIIRERTIIALKDFFWWVALFIFLTALFILIIVLFQKVYLLLETPTIKPTETSSMVPMGGAFIGTFIDGLILFIIVALFFNTLIRNILLGFCDCIALIFPQLAKPPYFYNKIQGHAWFPYILWCFVVFCFCLCNFFIYQIATIQIKIL